MIENGLSFKLIIIAYINQPNETLIYRDWLFAFLRDIYLEPQEISAVMAWLLLEELTKEKNCFVRTSSSCRNI